MTTPQTETQNQNQNPSQSPNPSAPHRSGEPGLRSRIDQAADAAPAWKNSPFRDELLALAQVRDELRLQLHLGRMEAIDRWDEAEARWAELQQQITAGTDPMSRGVKRLVEQLQEVYADHSS